MRITFVAIGWEQLGVSLLSAIAKQAGHEVNLAYSVSLFNDRYNLSIPSLASIFDDRKSVLAAIEKQSPDVLAFSPITSTYQWMLGIARDAKLFLPNVKVVFGGVHVSAVPERVLAQPQIDYICVGEGDVAFPLILKAIEEGGVVSPIPNTRYKLPDGQIVWGEQIGFIQDLDSLPIFDKPLWEDYIRLGDIYFTMASRGCPYRCTFCFNSFFAKLPEKNAGRYVRQRSIEHMLFELRQAKKRYKLHLVEFEDDVFTIDKKWLKNFLYQYKQEINVPFQCLTHPRYLDEEVARWLSDAGCRYIQMGIQTMDDEFKSEIVKRPETANQVERAMDAMRKYKINAKVDHMFGLLGEPLAAQEQARKLYVKYPPYRVQTFWTNFLPGTELVQQALENGVITAAEVEQLNEGKGFDFYRKTSRIEDPKKIKEYKAYEVFYKLIPLLPGFLRRTINPKIFRYLPSAVCAFISFTADAFWGLVSRNPDHIGYAKYYLYHLYRFFLGKIGVKVRPAIRPQNSEPFELNVPEKAKIEKIDLVKS